MSNVRVLLSAVLLLGAAKAQAGVLVYDSASADVERIRGEQREPLTASTDIKSGDALSLGPQSRARLEFARHGFIDLGSDALVLFDRLPFASYDDDLRTVFRLRQGYLRVVWKHPQISTNWPIYIYMGDQRLTLGSGEYFFENLNGRQVVCVASGQANVTEGEVYDTLVPQACYRLNKGLQPVRILRDSDDWVAMRTAFGVVGLPGVQVASAPAAPVPEPRRPGPQTSARSEPVVSAPERSPSPAAQAALPATAPIVAPLRRQPAPATVPAAVPADPTPLAASSAGPWALSVVAFRDREKSEAQALRLRGGGYPAEVRSAEVKGALWYRVVLPGFGSAEQAKRLSSEIEQRFGYKNTWPVRLGGPT